jgi:hypothetical protein
MKRIADELDRIELAVSNDRDFLTSHKYKADREWWILAKIIRNLQMCGEIVPDFATQENPPNPDFLTFSGPRQPFKPMEISEVLSPGRRRGDEYKTGKLSSPYRSTPPYPHVLPDPNAWQSLIECLNKKFHKRYQKDCWLLLYHNMISVEISNRGSWVNLVTEEAKCWAENRDNCCDLKSSPYERIIITDSSAEVIVELYPNIHAIRKKQHLP